MFDWLKKHFEKENLATTPKTKPVILTIHGYGRRRKHEFDNLALWGKKDGYDIVQFDMYDLFDEEDHDWMCWVQRAKDQLDQYKKTNRDIQPRANKAVFKELWCNPDKGGYTFFFII